MKIIKSEVKKMDLSSLFPFIKVFVDKKPNQVISPRYCNSRCVAGKIESEGEYYRLLAYLSTKFNNETLIDIGTHMGASATALSYSRNNKVITYDLPSRKTNPLGGIYAHVKVEELNIEPRYCNCMESEEEKEAILKSPLIFLDASHTGRFEREVYLFLKEHSYKGILILDDIHYTDGMEELWEEIDITKIDATEDIGHTEGFDTGRYDKPQGTGIVDFSNSIEILD
jgi:hypothetical protein